MPGIIQIGEVQVEICSFSHGIEIVSISLLSSIFPIDDTQTQ